MALAGGTSSGMSGGRAPYPIVTEPPPRYGPPVTSEGGAVIRRSLPPTTYDVAPSPTCERAIATFHDGSTPTRRPIVVPPRPGLRAEALSFRTVRVHWRFAALPSDCRPASLTLAILAYDDPAALPWKVTVRSPKDGGSVRRTYPTFLRRPTVALARASMDDGRSSRSARILIRR
jgi:hypothetical protein